MKINIKLLKKLVSTESTSNNTKKRLEVLELVKQSFKKNLITKKYNFGGRPSLVLSNTSSKNLDLIISTHADIVPANSKQFCLIERGDKLYGRGTYDMKATMLICLQVLEAFTKKNPEKKVAVFVTTDEELDGLSTKYLIEKAKYRAKFAIIPDGGGDCKLSIEQKGFMQIKINFKGKSSHASEPWKAKNSIDIGMEFYKELKKLFINPKNKSEWKDSVVLTKIISGNSINQIPANATFIFDIRFVFGKKTTDILNKIKKVLPKNTSMEVISQNGAHSIYKNNKFIKSLSASIKKINNKQARYVKDCSTSDAIFFTENKIPAVLLRPLGGNPHTENEWISKKSLEKFAIIINDFLENSKWL